MTKQELNRDIKRLLSLEKGMNLVFGTPKYDELSRDFGKEYQRLYFADSRFEAMNITSMRIMLRLNVRYRFIQLHTFGLGIEL